MNALKLVPGILVFLSGRCLFFFSDDFNKSLVYLVKIINSYGREDLSGTSAKRQVEVLVYIFVRNFKGFKIVKDKRRWNIVATILPRHI